MRKVIFAIPASPNAAFFSQISAFQRALLQLPWTRWQPTVRAYFGGPINFQEFAYWSRFLSEVEMTFLPDSRFSRESYFAQGNARLQITSQEADVLVLADADTLPVGPLENALDAVFEQRAIAGVMAHFPFSTTTGPAKKEDWEKIANEIIKETLSFDHFYSLMEDKSDNSKSPFYVNFGIVFISTAALEVFRGSFLGMFEDVKRNLVNPYFGAQVSLALTVAKNRMNYINLSMAYNYPNDKIADELHQDYLKDVRIFHYLRTNEFDRQSIFSTKEGYDNFLEIDLSGSNKIFQNFVRSIFGHTYPFS